MLVGALNFSRHFMAFRNLSLQALQAATPRARPCSSCSASRSRVVTMVLWLNDIYSGFRASHCGMRCSTSCRSRRPPASSPRTTRTGRRSLRRCWMLFLSCITCSTGSTGGGIKMFRTLLLVRQARRELKLLVHPSAVIPIRIGGEAIPDRMVYSVLAFIFLYFGTMLVLTFAMLVTGLDLVSSFSADRRLDQQPGPGPRRSRSGRRTFEPLTRRPDLDLHGRDAARAPGDLQRAGAVHRDVLAADSRGELSCECRSPGPRWCVPAPRSRRAPGRRWTAMPITRSPDTTGR